MLGPRLKEAEDLARSPSQCRAEPGALRFSLPLGKQCPKLWSIRGNPFPPGTSVPGLGADVIQPSPFLATDLGMCWNWCFLGG